MLFRVDDGLVQDVGVFGENSAGAAHLEAFLNVVVENVLLENRGSDGDGSKKKFSLTKAAKTVGVTKEAVQNAIFGLTKLLLDCSRYKVSERQFMLSTMRLTWSVQSKKLFYDYYVENKDTVTALARRYAVSQASLPSYEDLKWRLELQIASRMIRRDDYHPKFVMKLDLDSGETVPFEASYANLSRIHHELEQALNQSNSVHAQRVMKYLK